MKRPLQSFLLITGIAFGWQAVLMLSQPAPALCALRVECSNAFSGTATVTFAKGANTTHSKLTRVHYPYPCENPVITLQTYTDSVKCKSSTADVQGTCYNNPHTTSTDVHAYLGNRNESGFDVFLSSDDLIYTDYGDSFVISYNVVCS